MSDEAAEAFAIAELLRGARCARTDPAAAERAVGAALDAAPEDFTARLAAYKFYFYNHRYAEALPHAAHLVRFAARRLNIAADWRAVMPGDAAFDQIEEAPGLYMQALIAWGYCKARLGDAEGREAIARAAALDPRDRFGARRLLNVLDRGPPEED